MLDQRSARWAGFTLVEVMMASLILVVGFVGLIQAVAISSNMMDTARRQTLAAQIINHEIEKLRFLPWDDTTSTNDIVDLAEGTVTIDSQFDAAVKASGATFSLSRSVVYIDPANNSSSMTATELREVIFTVTWVVKTSRHKEDGSLVTFEHKRSNAAYFGKYGLNLTYQRS